MRRFRRSDSALLGYGLSKAWHNASGLGRIGEEALLGGVAAGCAAIFTNPLDVARVRLQLQREAETVGGPLRLIARAVRDEGPAVLTRGLGFALPYNALLNSTRFAAFHALSDANECGLPAPISGLIAGCVAGVVSSPLAKARTLQQNAVALDVRTSPMRVLLSDPFHGSLSWGVRNAGHTGIIFTVYSASKAFLGGVLPDAPPSAIHMAASLQAAVISCVAMNPVDVIATRMYSSSVGVHSSVGRAPAHTSPIACLVATVAGEGYRGLYRGLTANILRIMPHTVITFTMMELLRSWLRRREQASFQAALAAASRTQPEEPVLYTSWFTPVDEPFATASMPIDLFADPFDVQLGPHHDRTGGQ